MYLCNSSYVIHIHRRSWPWGLTPSNNRVYSCLPHTHDYVLSSRSEKLDSVYTVSQLTYLFHVTRLPTHELYPPVATSQQPHVAPCPFSPGLWPHISMECFSSGFVCITTLLRPGSMSLAAELTLPGRKQKTRKKQTNHEGGGRRCLCSFSWRQTVSSQSYSSPCIPISSLSYPTNYGQSVYIYIGVYIGECEVEMPSWK